MLFDMNVNHRLTTKLNQHNVRDSFTATSASVSGLNGKLGTHEVWMFISASAKSAPVSADSTSALLPFLWHSSL